MAELTLIRKSPIRMECAGYSDSIRLLASRDTLAKRRWRGAAEDGREFGFDLEHALPHGSLFFVEGTKRYVMEQAPEEVLEIPVTTREEAARVAWNLGNLHFGVEILQATVRVKDDPAVRHFLAREALSYRPVIAVFLPLSTAGHQHNVEASNHAHE